MTLMGFEESMIIYSFAGVAISYGKAKEADRKAYGLSTLLSRFTKHEGRLFVAEAVAFLALGCMISLGVTNPNTIPQALAAGLAWTGLATGK